MKVVLDSNILFSAVIFGGVPQEILEAAILKKFIAISSPVLVDELLDILRRKSGASIQQLNAIEKKVNEVLEIVYPRETVIVCRDKDDNQVLEAALEGKCDYIVTGDKDLLVLKKFKKIPILTPKEFLEILEKWFEK